MDELENAARLEKLKAFQKTYEAFAHEKVGQDLFEASMAYGVAALGGGEAQEERGEALKRAAINFTSRANGWPLPAHLLTWAEFKERVYSVAQIAKILHLPASAVDGGVEEALTEGLEGRHE